MSGLWWIRLFLQAIFVFASDGAIRPATMSMDVNQESSHEANTHHPSSSPFLIEGHFRARNLPRSPQKNPIYIHAYREAFPYI